MERYAVDLILGFLDKGLKVRVIANKVKWTGPVPVGLEFFLTKTPKLFGARVENLWFEQIAIKHINHDFPIIALSHIPAYSDLAITGGTHKSHLKRKGVIWKGFYHRKKIKNELIQFQKSKKVISHSAESSREIELDYNVSTNKIVTLYPPVDTKKFSLDARNKRENFRKEWGVNDNQIVIVFPSNDHKRKGLDLIISALEISDPRIFLAVAGRSPVKHNRVINLGYQTDMPGVYSAADVSILASIYEPFGYVGPESILCGTPTILADTVAATEVLSYPGCFKFERKTAALVETFKEIVKLFDENNLVLTNPHSYINYLYNLDDHIDALIEQLT